jgi:hypothetical protein
VIPLKKCEICMGKAVTQELSCRNCARTQCDSCYTLSVKLYGFVGDKNLVLPKPEKYSPTCEEWPYDEYYPEDAEGFKSTRGCIFCMTDRPPKRDKFGHFIRGDNYPQGERYLTRVIEETKACKKRKG